MTADTPERDDAPQPLAAWPEEAPPPITPPAAPEPAASAASRTVDLPAASATPTHPIAVDGADATATPTRRLAAEPDATAAPLDDAASSGGLRFVVPRRTTGTLARRTLASATVDQPGMLVIPGAARFAGPALPPRRRPRPVRMQALVLLVTLCVVLATALAVPGLRDSAIVSGPLNAFTGFATGAQAPDRSGFTLYRVRSGDTIEAIAATFGVTVGGIYKLNNFHLGDEITIGQVLKIPNDSAYGANFTLTAPQQPTTNTPANPGAPKGTVFGACVFCAIAGYSTGGLCAPPSQTNLGFGLIQPDPNAKFIRGFTWYHNGVDLSTGQYGTPIVAAQDGQVIFAAWDPYGFGFAVKINHCWGLATSYGHMEKILVHVGQFVHKGDVIGLQGSTGMSTGPHCHFMVWWDNNYVNPLEYYTHLGFPYP